MRGRRRRHVARVRRQWNTGLRRRITGLGTTHLAATLTLDVPTSTAAGTYAATLTLTAL